MAAIDLAPTAAVNILLSKYRSALCVVAGLLLICSFANGEGSPPALKIACIGDSITFGAGIKQRKTKSYPAQLSGILGDRHDVRNFGVNGATLLKNGDKPYWNLPKFRAAQDYQPDIVVIKLGTNDTKPQNWKYHSDFVSNYTEMIETFQRLESRPRVLICYPIPAFPGRWGIHEKTIREELLPQIQTVAQATGVELIDLYKPMQENAKLVPDTVHPNAAGAKIIAQTVARALEQTASATNEGDVSASPWVEGKSLFHSFRQYTFELEGVACKVVVPHVIADGKPWLWRARFWGHKPQVDIALLQQGYHVVYTAAKDLYGAPSAMDRWDRFYAYLTTQHGFEDKAVLMGLSRGGLFVYNWATRNPDKVHAIYADAPVCDFKSWPGGLGLGKGSPKDWKKCLEAYQLTEVEALSYTGNPIDNLQPLAKADIPLLHVVGDVDKVVPVAENTALLKERYEALGGSIQVIHKPGTGHHPHGLKSPEPIVEFILKSRARSDLQAKEKRY